VTAAAVAAALLGVPAAPMVPAAAAPAAKPACPVDRPDEAAALATARACGGEVKIAGLTNEYDEGWAQPNGQVHWQHHFRPVRAEQNNAWVPVDTTLVADPDGTVRPKAAAVDLTFSGGGSAPMVTVGEDGGTLRLGSPLGSLPKPVLDGDTATYPEVLPGVDLKLRADVDGYAQVLVVKDRQAAENARLAKLQFPVSQSGLTLSTDKAGNLTAAGKDGKTRLVGNAPLMWDAPVQDTADGTPRAGGRTKVMPSSLAGGKLSVTPVQAMLDDPATVYPVYLDPGVQAARSAWTMIDSGNPTTSYWNSSQNARVGTNNGGTNKYRSFYNLNLLSLGGQSIAAKRIMSSTLWVKETGSASCAARRVDLWHTPGVTSATTWNNPPEYLSLQSSQTVAKGFSSACPAGSVGFDATQVTQDAANAGWKSVALALRSPDETDNSYYKEFDNNPYLSISYQAWSTITVTSVGTQPSVPCVTGAGRPLINTATPLLWVRVADPAGASVRAEIEWSAVGGSKIGSALTPEAASGQMGIVRVPAGAFADGSYSWRARGQASNTWGPWRSPCEFTVDTTAPSAPPTVASTTYPSGQWAGGAATAGTFTFGPAGVSDAAAYEYGLDTNPPTQTVAASAIGGSGTVSITPGTDGPHSLYVRTRDRAGYVSATTRYDFKVGTGSVEDAEAAAAAIVVRNIDDVRGNLTLPTSGTYDTTITWSSSNSEVIDGAGVVHRHPAGRGATTVTLTATVKSGEASATRDFTATVPELPAAQPKTGYLFSYFMGEGTADGEQIYSALSKANDPISYQQVKIPKPVLTSTLGTKGLRDPFIIRSPEGDKFYQIATDLKIDGNGDGDASQRTGSKSIMVWESTDLVNWTDQRLVKVSPDTAGNTWAPEAYYDETLGAYVVFWASNLYDAADTGHTGSTYNRLMYATTRDFYTFSEPKVWKDPGYSATDSTMIEHNGTYYRFTKDEPNTNSDSPCNKFITEEKSTSILNTDYDFVGDCIGWDSWDSISAGEGPLVFKSNTEDRWYLFSEEHGGRGYTPFTTTDLDSGKWTKVTDSYSLPRNARHGTVLPITQAEYDRLLTAYRPNPLGTSVDPSR
jgi:hypothetical protein